MASMKTYRLRRALAIEYLGGCCAKCGTTQELQIDHIDPATKTLNLGKRWDCPIAVYMAELDKCQLLCKTHHESKSRLEMLKSEHGSHSGLRRGCKCTECRLYSSEKQKRYRARQKTAS